MEKYFKLFDGYEYAMYTISVFSVDLVCKEELNIILKVSDF